MFFFFSSRRRHTRFDCDWSSDVCSSDLVTPDAPGRYLTATGRPSLGSTGRERGAAGVTLVDEWVGVRARLEWAPVAELAWGPVQTVSVSEAGFERIYQGTALLIVWPVELRTGEPRELSASITLERS